MVLHGFVPEMIHAFATFCLEYTNIATPIARSLAIVHVVIFVQLLSFSFYRATLLENAMYYMTIILSTNQPQKLIILIVVVVVVVVVVEVEVVGAAAVGLAKPCLRKIRPFYFYDNFGKCEPFLPARRSKRGLCYGNVSVRPSICPSQPVLYQND